MDREIREGLLNLLCVGDKLKVVCHINHNGRFIGLCTDQYEIVRPPYKHDGWILIDTIYLDRKDTWNTKYIYEYEGELYYSGGDSDVRNIEWIKEAVENEQKD